MLHGLAGSNLELARLSQRLHIEGFTVYGPNIHGYCFGTEPSSYENWIVQAKEAYQNLNNRCATVSICGISMGATLALALAGEIPDISSVILLATCMDYKGWAVPWYQALLPLAKLLPFELKLNFPEEFPYGVKNDQLRARVRNSLLRKQYAEVGGYSIPFALVQQGHELIQHVQTVLDAVECPALVMHAIEDEICSIIGAETMYSKLSSKQKEFIYLDDCYHLITVDNQRNTVYKEVTRFISYTINRQLQLNVFPQSPVVHPELKRIESLL